MVVRSLRLLLVVAAAVVVLGTAAWGWQPPLLLAVPLASMLLVALVRSSDQPAPMRPGGSLPAVVLERELDRCRRHERRCALVRLRDVDVDDPGLVAGLRCTDVAWAAGRDVIVLLPETGRAEACDTAVRLFGQLADLAAIAAFPEDALTAHGLLEAVRRGPAAAPAPHEEPVAPSPPLAVPAPLASPGGVVPAELGGGAS